MNSYNPTKDSLLSAQSCLRDPCTETSKVGQVGATREGEKAKELKETVDAALQPGVHCRTQAREGRNQVMAGTTFS